MVGRVSYETPSLLGRSTVKVNEDNLIAAVQRLIDEADIKRVLYTYSFNLDGANPEGMLEVFDEDIYVAYGPEHGARSREEYLHVLSNDKTGIAAFFAATSHHVSNVDITFVDEDTAHVKSVLLAWHKYNRERPNGIVYGQYRDIVKRVDGEWKIQRREQVTAGTDNYHAKPHMQIPLERKSIPAQS